MKYRVIKEYDRFYLAIHPNGYKECFQKYKYKPDKDGYIIKETYEYSGGQALPPEKVNTSFNLK